VRRVSLKRQQLMREVKPWRDAFKARVGRCEYCLKPRMADALAVHEISRGSHRRKALASEFAVLAVCLEPWGDPPCHDTVQGWPEVKQLALLYLVRQSDYDLQAFLEMTNYRAPRRIMQSEVDREIRWLLEARPNLLRQGS
jgi:hypothetical protein